MTGAKPLPGPGAAGGSGREKSGACGLPGRGERRSASWAQIAAGEASTARSAGLRCASAGSSVTTTTLVPDSTSGPGANGYCRKTGAPTLKHEVPAGQGGAEPGAVGREEAGKEWVVLRKAGAGAERLLPDRAAQPLRQPGERGPGIGVGRSRAGNDRRRLGAFDQRRQLGDRLVVGGACGEASVSAKRARRRRRARASRPSGR